MKTQSQRASFWALKKTTQIWVNFQMQISKRRIKNILIFEKHQKKVLWLCFPNLWKIKIVASSCGVLSLEKTDGILSVILYRSTLENFVDLIFKSLPGIAKELDWQYHFKSQNNNNLCILFNIESRGDISSKVLMFMDKLQVLIKR